MSKPLIIMVGADKGGVGKTTVARLLADYIQAKSIGTRLFDAEYPNGDLKRFAGAAEIVDLVAVGDQMRVFDSVAGTTVVDVRAGMLSGVLAALNEVKLLDDVRSGALNLALLHVVGPSMGSLEEIGKMATALGSGAHHMLVKNHVSDGGFFEWDANSKFKEMFDNHVTIDVPHLTPRATETVQLRQCSFQAFANDTNNSRMLRGYVQAWLDKCWIEFDRVGLGQLIAGSV